MIVTQKIQRQVLQAHTCSCSGQTGKQTKKETNCRGQLARGPLLRSRREKVVEELKPKEIVQFEESEEIAIKDEKNIDGVFLLSLLQKQGRLVDFLQQDITTFSNAEVGEAARVVHEGCARILGDYFTMEVICAEEEGAVVNVGADYNLSEITLTGNLRGSAPYRGELLHHGWKISDQHPPEQLDPRARFIVQPAEIEVR